jgi:hypothetical protein
MMNHRQRLILEIDEARDIAAHFSRLTKLWENIQARRVLELAEYDRDHIKESPK